MEYEYFIGMVKQYESECIKAYTGNLVCSATTRIPKPFGLLIGDIISILEQNISSLCSVVDETLVIMGFQPAGFMIQSAKPQLYNRMIDRQHNNQHFCCTLEYQVVAKEMKARTWECTRSLIVDFTTGEIMNNDCYLSRLNTELAMPQNDGVFGKINNILLDTAWQMVRIRYRNKLAQVA